MAGSADALIVRTPAAGKVAASLAIRSAPSGRVNGVSLASASSGIGLYETVECHVDATGPLLGV